MLILVIDMMFCRCGNVVCIATNVVMLVFLLCRRIVVEKTVNQITVIRERQDA